MDGYFPLTIRLMCMPSIPIWVLILQARRTFAHTPDRLALILLHAFSGFDREYRVFAHVDRLTAVTAREPASCTNPTKGWSRWYFDGIRRKCLHLAVRTQRVSPGLPNSEPRFESFEHSTNDEVTFLLRNYPTRPIIFKPLG